MTPNSRAVIILEDNQDIATLMSQLLVSYGATPIICTDLADVETALDAHNVALILLDIMLPGEDGRDVARALRTRSCGVPIYFMTGIQEVDMLPEDRALADGYLQKPFTIFELRETLDAALHHATANDASASEQVHLELMAMIATERENIRRQQTLLRGFGGEIRAAEAAVVLDQLQNFTIRLDRTLARISEQLDQVVHPNP